MTAGGRQWITSGQPPSGSVAAADFTFFNPPESSNPLFPNHPAGCLTRGRYAGGALTRLPRMSWVWWWAMEIVVLDIAATFVLLGAYLAVVIRKSVV